jgi:hypothetical protein
VAYRLATSWALCGAQGGPASDMNALVFASNRDRDKAAADLLGSLGAALPGGVLVGDRFIVYGSSGLAGGLPPVAARVGGVIRPN